MNIIRNINHILEYNNSISPLISQLAKPLFENFNIRDVTYIRFFKDRILRISTNEAWFKLFIEKGYQDKPSFQQDINRLGMQDTCIIFRNDPNNIITKTAREFGLWHGLTIYQRSGSNIELWNFTTIKANDQITSFYFNNINLLKRFIFYLKNKIPEVFDCNDNKCLIELKNELILDSYLKPDIEREKDFLSKTDLDKFYLKDQEYIKVTKRETECLYLLSLGKSIKDISRILNISPRTVDTHINNFKARIMSVDKPHLIKKYQLQLSEYYKDILY